MRIEEADRERGLFRGAWVSPGHIGGIYQALKGAYLGTATARTHKLLPDGTVLSDRAIQKIRAQETGWHYAAELLVNTGEPSPGPDVREWLRLWLPLFTRPLTHPGNQVRQADASTPARPPARLPLPGIPEDRFGGGGPVGGNGGELANERGAL